MENFQVYRDIQARTGGDIYIGVVGPVRTGKSTFIRRFMELVALPAISEGKRAELQDELPLSGAGKMITTVEPKFIPKEAVEVSIGENQKIRVKLIDCVGFLVKDASGNVEEGRERMVKTPWQEKAIPFHDAARIGTEKVISQHSTIGIVVTTDGSFGEIPRENFIPAEEQTVKELKAQGKPFLLLVNSQTPYGEETGKIVKNLEEKYGVSVLAVNCEQLRKEDVTRIREKMTRLTHVRDVNRESIRLESPYVEDTLLEQISLSDGTVRVRIAVKDIYYYQMLSEMSGISMESEYELIQTMKELAGMKEQFVKVQAALEAVKGTGYGVVVPELSEITIEEPEVIRQGNKFGVKIRSKSPSIHMIRAGIETEIAPIVGTEQQAEDLIKYIKESPDRGESIWETNIFGKSIQQLVEDGIKNKLAMISEESQVKLQDTMQKIVNDSKGGLVCIII